MAIPEDTTYKLRVYCSDCFKLLREETKPGITYTPRTETCLLRYQGLECPNFSLPKRPIAKVAEGQKFYQE